jgi:hypothetical protein
MKYPWLPPGTGTIRLEQNNFSSQKLARQTTRSMYAPALRDLPTPGGAIELKFVIGGHALVAQLVEHGTFNAGVLGSSPNERIFFRAPIESTSMYASPMCRKLWVLAVVLVGSLGCGGQTLYQVKGAVAYKDESDVAVLANGLVLFDPVDTEVKVSARGEIQPDGSFRMSTFREGDGVIPGKYRVMLAPPAFRGKRNEVRPELLDPSVQDFETSGLTITVTEPVTDYVLSVQKPR